MHFQQGGNNAANTITLPAEPNMVYNVSQLVFSWAGVLASGSVLKVVDGTTEIFSVDASIALNDVISIVFANPLQGSVNTAMTIEITAGGIGSSSKLNADYSLS